MTQGLENPADAGMSANRLARIRPVLQRYVDEADYGGFVTRVYRHGRLVHAENIGWQDREADVPMAKNTLFRIYSMTKPIVCSALMMLYEEGYFQLVDPVSKFLPAFGATKVRTPDGKLVDQNPLRPMQVRDLMTHTSGLSYDFLDDYPVAAQYRDAQLMHDSARTLEDLIDKLATFPLAFHPGAKWHYSLGIDVAARLIEVLSGQRLGDFLSNRLFEPLRMTETGFGIRADQQIRLAAMYGHPDLLADGMSFKQIIRHFAEGNRARREVADTYPTDKPDVFQRGGLGLFSTADDYLAFARMLLDGKATDGTRLLGRKTLELMHTNHLAPQLLPYDLAGKPIPGWGFGLGSRVAMDLGQMGVSGTTGEFGWSGAAKTYYWVDPREDLVGVLMTQFMIGFDLPENDFRAVVYQAIDD